MQPDVCAHRAARFGHRDARLYPLLGSRVQTRLGFGVLQQVLIGQAVVLLESGRVGRVAAEDVRAATLFSSHFQKEQAGREDRVGL